MSEECACRYAVLCPVCRVQIDTYTGDISGIGPAMVLGNSWGQHSKESPSCKNHDDWVIGWLLEQVPDTDLSPFKEGDKSKAICYRCGHVVTTTLRLSEYIIADRIVPDVLLGFCDECGDMVSIPHQSAKKIHGK